MNKLNNPRTEAEAETVDPVDSCQQPCHPNAGCPICADYWNVMRRKGLWVDGEGWTRKGLFEMMK